MDSESGHSLSTFFMVLCLALFAATGLVVDGGGYAVAKRQAQTSAQSAAQAGTNSLAAQKLSGSVATLAVVSDVQDFLHAHGYADHQVQVHSGDLVSVKVNFNFEPVFLSVIGIKNLSGTAQAQSQLFKK